VWGLGWEWCWRLSFNKPFPANSCIRHLIMMQHGALFGLLSTCSCVAHSLCRGRAVDHPTVHAVAAQRASTALNKATAH
jgi:hypothetical protein